MKHTRELIFFGIALAFSSTGCGGAARTDESGGAAEQPSICGATNDMQDVELYDGTLGPSVSFVAAHQRPVGMVRWKNDLAARYTNRGNTNGAAWCTATLIADDTLITAGHCFDPDGNGWTWPRDNATGNAITPEQGAQEMKIEFDYQLDASGAARPIVSFDVASLVEHRLGNMDYAIIKISGNAGSSYGKTTISPFPLVIGDDITIIQHPAGQLKKVHAGDVVSLGASNISYATADTLGGSSGSGVLSTVTGYLQAVHTNAGCNATGGSNTGMQVAALYNASPSIRLLSLDSAKLSAVL